MTSQVGHSLGSVRFSDMQTDTEERAMTGDKVQTLEMKDHLHFLIFGAADKSGDTKILLLVVLLIATLLLVCYSIKPIFIERLLHDWQCFCSGSTGVTVVTEISFLTSSSLHSGGGETGTKHIHKFQALTDSR